MSRFILSIIIIACLSSCNSTKSTSERKFTNNPDSLKGKNTYVNPVDGKSYSTKGEFAEYTPEEGQIEATGPVKAAGTILLTSEREIAKMIGVQELADFIKQADELVISELSDVDKVGKLLIQFTLHSQKESSIDMSYGGELEGEDLGEVYQKVEALCKPFRVKRDSCVFQNIYTLNSD